MSPKPRAEPAAAPASAPTPSDQKGLYERQSEIRGDMAGHYRWFAPARRLEETLRLAGSGSVGRLLEVGCGDGVLLSALAGSRPGGPELVAGLDLSIGRLRRARGRLAAAFVCGSAERLPFRPASIDLVVCAEVLEHVLDPAGVLAELSRVTKPGGRLILSVPVVGWSRWLETRLTGRVRFLDEAEHLREYAPRPLPRCETVASLRAALERVGFQTVEERGVYAFPHRGERLWQALLARGPLHGPAVAFDRAFGRSPARRWGRYLLIDARRRAVGGNGAR